MLKRAYRAVVCSLLLVSGSSALMAAEAVAERPLVFVTQDFPPFNYLEQGQVKGAVVELIDRICKEIARRCEHQLLPWTRAQSRIKNGAADGIYTIGKNPDRQKWLVFTPAILTTEYGFFVRQSNPIEITRAEDIRGYQVGVFGPSNTSRSLLLFRGDNLAEPKYTKQAREQAAKHIFNIRMTPDDDTGLRQLPVGRIDAVYSNRDVGWAMIRKLGLKDIRYTGSQKSLDYYIGFSKEFADMDAVERFRQSYIKLLQQGVITEILAPYKLRPKFPD